MRRMKRIGRDRGQWFGLLFALAVGVGCAHPSPAPPAAVDPLPSWHNGPVKAAILAFVAEVTYPPGKGFVPAEDRIATFDNDGTLWPEQPVIQALFIESQLKARVAQNPALARRQPFKAVLTGDKSRLVRGGEAALMPLVAATSANMTDEQYRAEVQQFFATVQHPSLKRPFTALAYRPMIELMELLRANGFKVFISSGGGVDFMRVVSQQMYGVPPEQRHRHGPGEGAAPAGRADRAVAHADHRDHQRQGVASR